MKTSSTFSIMILCMIISSYGFSEPTRSGAAWCTKFPGGNTLQALTETFRVKVRNFIDALREGGAKVHISSTRRPEQRQYLMHWSWRIGREAFFLEAASPCIPDSPGTKGLWFCPEVPDYVGDMTLGPVEIIWRWSCSTRVPCTIRNCDQKACTQHYHDLTESIDAANEMVEGYNLAFRPARNSRHNSGRAIDMTISWTGELTVLDRNGTMISISSSPKNGMNPGLHAIGATYGVYKLVSDPPHWSDDGH